RQLGRDQDSVDLGHPDHARDRVEVGQPALERLLVLEGQLEGGAGVAWGGGCPSHQALLAPDSASLSTRSISSTCCRSSSERSTTRLAASIASEATWRGRSSWACWVSRWICSRARTRNASASRWAFSCASAWMRCAIVLAFATIPCPS